MNTFRANLINKGKAPRKGAALILALILLALGSLMVVPLLDYVGGSFKSTSQVYSSSTDELYCADAGVRDAIWQITHAQIGDLAVGATFNKPAGVSLSMNGKTGDYTITRLNNTLYNAVAYRIQAQGSDPNTSHTTSITTDVTVIDFALYLQNALTSPGTITSKNTDQIWDGTVQAPIMDPTMQNPDPGSLKAQLMGTASAQYTAPIGWPTLANSSANAVQAFNDAASNYYLSEVPVESPLAGSVIDIGVPGQSGPLYASGLGNYTMQGVGSLKGTIFVNGNLTIQGGTVLNLCYDDGVKKTRNTLFVTGNLAVLPQSEIRGEGAIIALGNITFEPNITNYDFFVYLMSIRGTIDFQPRSNFVGSIAGQSNINLQPNTTIRWTQPPAGLNLPGLYRKTIGRIVNWKVN